MIFISLTVFVILIAIGIAVTTEEVLSSKAVLQRHGHVKGAQTASAPSSSTPYSPSQYNSPCSLPIDRIQEGSLTAEWGRSGTEAGDDSPLIAPSSSNHFQVS